MGLLGLEAFQTVANQGRGGMQRQGRSSQETIVQPWSKVLVQHQGTYHNTLLSPCLSEPGYSRLPFPGPSSSGVWRARSLRLIASPVPAAQFSGCAAGALLRRMVTVQLAKPAKKVLICLLHPRKFFLKFYSKTWLAS